MATAYNDSSSSSSDEDLVNIFLTPGLKHSANSYSSCSDTEVDETKIGKQSASVKRRSSADTNSVKGGVTKRPRPSASHDGDTDDKDTTRSRLSAKECRARKKLRYQYLEELVTACEQVVLKMKEELEQVRYSIFG